MSITPICPDCRDGKCGACIGDAFDFVKDEPTDCMCACRTEGSRAGDESAGRTSDVVGAGDRAIP